jgi:methyltransferase
MTWIAAAVVAAFMLLELRLSRRHEQRLLDRGAVAADDPVYPIMRWAYPGAFLAMAIEGAVTGPPPIAFTAAGVAVFVAAKALKFWAVASLGERWTYRVFVLPDEPLVSSGPYRYMRHPNYVGVVGELAGMALLAGSRVTGPLSLVFFGWLLSRRIKAEEKALRIS